MPVDFHVVSKQVFKILINKGNCCAYVPVTFDELHFTRTKLMVHTAILDLELDSGTNLDKNENDIPTSQPKPAEMVRYKDLQRMGKGQVNDTDIESIYGSSAAILISTYETVKTKFSTIKNCCLTELLKTGIEDELVMQTVLLNSLIVGRYLETKQRRNRAENEETEQQSFRT